MELTEMTQETVQRPRRHREPGVRHHLLTYAFSLITTAIAFLVIVNYVATPKFMSLFIVLLATCQALFQIMFWMHLGEKGHLFPRISMFIGAVIIIATIITAIYWMW